MDTIASDAMRADLHHLTETDSAAETDAVFIKCGSRFDGVEA